MADTNLQIIIEATDKASKVISDVDKKLTLIRTALNSLQDQSFLEDALNEFSELKDKSEDAKEEINQVGEAVENVNEQDVTDVTDSFRGLAIVNREINDGLLSVSETIRTIGQRLTILSAGLSTFLGLAAQQFLQFNEAIAEVSTLVDSSVVSNQDLQVAVTDLSNAFGKSPIGVAKALYQAISAGAEAGAEANNLLTVAIKGSIAGVTTTETVVDGLTTVMNAFQLSTGRASDVADILFTTMKNGKTTIAELSANLFQAVPIAAAVGLSFAELSGAIIGLTLQGTPTNVAMTQIRAAITGLLRPTADLVFIFQEFGGVQKALAEFGLEFVFQRLAAAVDGDIGKLKTILGSIEGVNAVLALTGKNASFLSEGINKTTNSVGALGEAFDKVVNEPFQRFNEAATRLGVSFNQLGEVSIPLFEPIVVLIGELIQAVGNFIRSNEEFVSVIIAVGIALLTLTGFLLALSSSLTLIGVKILVINAVFPVLAARIGTAITAIITFGKELLITRIGIDFINGRLITLGGILRGLAVGGLIGVLGTVLVIALSRLNAEGEKTIKTLEAMGASVTDLVNNNQIRSINALEKSLKSLNTLSRTDATLLLKEFRLRQKIIANQIVATKEQISLVDTLFGKFTNAFGLFDSNIDQQVKVLESLKQKNIEVTESIDNLRKNLTERPEDSISLFRTALQDSASLITQVKNSGGAIKDFISAFTAIDEITFDDAQKELERVQDDLIAAVSLREQVGNVQIAKIGANFIESQRGLQAAASASAIERKRQEVDALLKQIDRKVEDEGDAEEKLLEKKRELAIEFTNFQQGEIEKQRVLVSDQISSLRDNIRDVNDDLARIARDRVVAERDIEGAIRAIRQRGLSETQVIAEEITRVNELVAKRNTALINGEIKRVNDLNSEIKTIADSIGRVGEDVAVKIGGEIFDVTKIRDFSINLLKEVGRTLQEVFSLQEQAATDSAEIFNISLESAINKTKELNEQFKVISKQSISVNFELDSEGLTDQIQRALTDTTFSASITAIMDGNAIRDQLVGIFQSISIPGAATGGFITGPGTSTSDSILARLSRGEFVIKASSVKSLGLGFLEKLNAGGSQFFNQIGTFSNIIPKFMSGGHVPFPIPKFADGGLVSVPQATSGQSSGSRDVVDVNLNFEGQQFSLQGDRDIVSELTSALKAMQNQIIGG